MVRILVRAIFLVYRWPSIFLLYPHMVERRERTLVSSSPYKGTDPIHEGFTLMT